MSKLQDYLDKIHDPIMAKQLWEDQLIWGRAIYNTDKNGVQTRLVPFSDEWEAAVAKIKENE